MGQNKDHRLAPEEFDAIYSRVPRLTVEIVVVSERGVLLSLRDIEPCKGQWHLPGGTVYFGEKLTEAVERIARRELGIKITNAALLGYIEYPSHYENGLDSPVGIAFKVEYTDEIKANDEASKLRWFEEVPKNIHADQDKFLLDVVLSAGSK